MTNLWLEEKTNIARLRVRPRGLDPQTAGRRAARLLELADLHPRGLPPDAVLCVRRLGDPLPGRLRLDGRSMRPPSEWESAVTNALEHLARQAARPTLGAVPAQAMAVLFNNPAEMLACLAADWMKGELASRWWWPVLLKTNDLSRAAYLAWLGAPEYIPPALALLAGKKQAMDFGRSLDESLVRELLSALAIRFVLPDLQAILQAGRPEEGWEDFHSPVRAEIEPLSRPAVTGPVQEQRPGLVPPPWAAWVPESVAPDIEPLTSTLLGIGLLLVRAPYRVRIPEFGAALRTWWASIQSQPDQPARRMNGPLSGPALAGWAKAVLDAASSPQLKASPEIELPVSFPNPPSWPPIAWPTIPAGEPEFPGSGQPVAPPGSPWAPESERPAKTKEPPAVPAEKPAAVDRPQPLEARIETLYGGLFYLLNLAVSLGLYGDFASSDPGLALSPWDFLALLGRALLGEPFLADPLWPFLARLAGRPVDAGPGEGFTPPENWRIPVEWLAQVSGGSKGNRSARKTVHPRRFNSLQRPALTWSARGGRLRVWHQAGFWVLDVPIPAHPPRLSRPESGRMPPLRARIFPILIREMRPYRDVAVIRRRPGNVPRPEDIGSPLDRWLGWLLAYFDLRLHQGLGVGRETNLASFLYAHPARLELSAARLDITMSLEELPLEIRLSGLDRDLGWLPAAGRWIFFHFE